MTPSSQFHGNLIRISPDKDTPPSIIPRIPLGAPATDGGIPEDELQGLLFKHPQALPLASIDAAYADAIPICRELSTAAGYVDALFVNAIGRITIAEFKLWRNPQARREVIGQILDYTREIASWSYEDLQREVSKTLRKQGNVLFDRVRAAVPGTDEAEFVDRVTRHLRRGEFLLLIIGDGIRESAENIVDFVQKYSGLHFNLALVEAALYRDADNSVIVQPRVLARTEIVQRIVLDEGLTPHLVDETREDLDDVLSDLEEENLRFWTAVLDGFEFSDIRVEVPKITKDQTLYIKVHNSGWGDWALTFSGYLYRKEKELGCYLTCRKGEAVATRVFGELENAWEDLERELEGIKRWDSKDGRPRIGITTQSTFPFDTSKTGENAAERFEDSVAWMRGQLNLLVSTLHPKIERLIARDG